MSRGKQYVKKGVWYLGGKRKKKKRKKQKSKGFPIGLLASVAAPILGQIASPILKKIFGKGKKIR